MFRLCHSALPECRTFEYPTSSGIKMADEENREVEIEVLRSGDNSGSLLITVTMVTIANLVYAFLDVYRG